MGFQVTGWSPPPPIHTPHLGTAVILQSTEAVGSEILIVSYEPGVQIAASLKTWDRW